MKDALWLLFYFTFVAVLVLGSLSIGCARYNECRRVHPGWYCITK